jgi:hypothetical protein
MPRGEFWRASRLRSRDERSAIVADCEIRDGGMKEGCRIVPGRVLRRLEALKRLGVSPRSLKHHAKPGVRGSSPTVRLRSLIAAAMLFAHGASRPRRNRLATSAVFFAALSEEHSRMEDAYGRPLGHEPAAMVSWGETRGAVAPRGEAQAYRHYQLGTGL